MKTLKEQSEIVKQRLHYHFAKVGGGWDIEGMNAPFMKEFLNEVELLCALSNVVGRSEQLKAFLLYVQQSEKEGETIVNNDDFIDGYLKSL